MGQSMPLPSERNAVLASFRAVDISPVNCCSHPDIQQLELRCCNNPEIQREDHDVFVRLPLITDSADDEIAGSRSLMRILTGDSSARPLSVDSNGTPIEAIQEGMKLWLNDMMCKADLQVSDKTR